jgi:oxygen-independent coproporphyrinogen-3 oxidase
LSLLNSNLNSKIVNQKSLSGVYIHIPFCKQACNYCNFHFSTSLKYKDDLIQSLLNEINITPYFIDARNNDTIINQINTIYFGGGTPSILNADELRLIFDALHKKFIISGDAEITLEANPDDINREKLAQWKNIGINRLSVGIQSFNEEELKWMNRAHNATDSLRCIEQISNEGFTNFSVDLIYGSPLLTNDDWKRNAEIIIEKKIPHISCYALTIEPKTALDKMIRLYKSVPVDHEKQADQFLLLMNWMKQAGYEHYEISNYALPGMRSKHNSSYWAGKTYYGFGPSAHSFDGKNRRWNIANNALYIKSLKENNIPFEEETLTPVQHLNEYIMTSLRTSEGLDLNKVATEFGITQKNELIRKSNKYITGKKLLPTHTGLNLTTEGKLFADGIAADLFFD